MVSVMKLEKAPTESYADVGGLEQQIQEIKVYYSFLLFKYIYIRININVLIIFYNNKGIC